MIILRQSPSLPYRSLLLFSRFASSSNSKSASSKRWLNRANSDHYSREAKESNYKSRAAFKLLQIDSKFKLFNGNSQNIVDLGYAPGAWSQVAYERTKKTGTILGIDILPCQPIAGVNSMQANILSKQTHENVRKFFIEKQLLKERHQIGEEELMSYIDKEMEEMKISDDANKKSKVLIRYPVDVVISDMCVPFLQTTGFWNSTTNAPYFRMANTSGLQIKDHLNSMDLCDAALILAIDLLKPGSSFTCKFFTGKEDVLLEQRLSRVFQKVHRFKPDACRDDSKECYFVCLNKKENVDKMKVFS